VQYIAKTEVNQQYLSLARDATLFIGQARQIKRELGTPTNYMLSITLCASLTDETKERNLVQRERGNWRSAEDS
jgi:hypothetical protein